MTKSKKIFLAVLVLLGLVLVAGINFTIGWRPFLGPRTRATNDRKIERTPERVARGQYMVELMGCESCHSPKRWNEDGAPDVPGMQLAGQVFALPGLPGEVVVPNLTGDADTGAAGWSDDQIARSIREGIGHDGRTIFPIMPYRYYRNLSDEDVDSVVAYLRTLPAVHNPLPPTRIKFPVNYLVRSAPQPVTEPVHGPNLADAMERGKYLVKLGCGCHDDIAGLPFAGGENLEGPWGKVTSANITPGASGIGYYDEATFIKALRTGTVGARKLNSIMPFGAFKNLTDDDLKAMFAYLRTLTPVAHRVDNSLPPTYCKLCKSKHGAGDQN